MTTYPNIELRHHYDDELDGIRSSIIDMGTLVLANIVRAGVVITENRLDEVAEVQAADLPVNERYRDCEAKVFQVLALQQPVASDLRFLVASTRIVYEIERSGDLAVNLVTALARIDGIPVEPVIESLLVRLANASARLFRQGIEALATMDPEIGTNAEEADEVVDDLTANLYKAVTSRQEELGLEAAVALFRMGRFFERIADHGVNIAENVTFMVTGSLPDED